MKIDFIHKIQHIGIPVHNMEISIPFYERLGFENVMESPFEFDGGFGTCVMMKNHEVIVELYQMPEKQLAEIKQRKVGHIDHFAIDAHPHKALGLEPGAFVFEAAFARTRQRCQNGQSCALGPR